MARTSFNPKVPIIIIEAVVRKNSERALRLALDTGCSRTIIPFEIAQRIGCNAAGSSKRTRIITGSGIEIVPLVNLKSIKALGKTLRNLEVACHDLPAEGFVDGLLGLDFLKNFNLCVKFKKGMIEIT